MTSYFWLLNSVVEIYQVDQISNFPLMSLKLIVKLLWKCFPSCMPQSDIRPMWKEGKLLEGEVISLVTSFHLQKWLICFRISTFKLLEVRYMSYLVFQNLVQSIKCIESCLKPLPISLKMKHSWTKYYKSEMFISSSWLKYWIQMSIQV